MKGTPAWPNWLYFPSNTRPPQWVAGFVDVVTAAEPSIQTVNGDGSRLSSDGVLAAIRTGLTEQGYKVESGKAHADKIRRPVLFGENGTTTVMYEIDAVHDELGIVVEVEAGRGARGNAAYRDLVRTSLIVDARYLALMMPIAYRINNQTKGATDAPTKQTIVPAYRDAAEMLRAVYASQRLRLPFEGVLLIGY